MGDDIVRTGEWQRVRQYAADAAGRATPAALAIEGEAGAGKSTLWRAGVPGLFGPACRSAASSASGPAPSSPARLAVLASRGQELAAGLAGEPAFGPLV